MNGNPLFRPFLLLAALFALLVAPLTTSYAGERTIAGPSGERVTIERGGVVATIATPETPSSEELLAPGERVTFTYQSSGGTVVVEIVPQPGENDDSVARRLHKRVRAMRNLFPPDGPPTGG